MTGAYPLPATTMYPSESALAEGPRPDLGRHVVPRVLPSARCTVYHHVSAGWSEL